MSPPADTLWTLPFFIDTGVNALDLYDSVGWWDGREPLLQLDVAQRSVRGTGGTRIASAWVLAGLCIGFGATTAIIWELLEYWTFIRDSPELATAYEDGSATLGWASVDRGRADRDVA